MSKCQCGMTGDGCRYCQPQEYIDRLSEMLGEILGEERDRLSDAQAIIDGLRADNERLKRRIKILDNCTECGKVYAERDQLKAENERLDKDNDRLTIVADNALDERDTLRKQLDEVRELMMLGGFAESLIPRLYAWLEANKK